ncbi:winged helix DNA-binding protein [Larsenimonas rhizosphaerae]|uniref:Winged helix DNA-binding protein n=1 Tax=Larsenimonas rhizosphaerae TaxID=2944682 RepID=A0AA42CTD2_9GAMM|nr:winged helix DNA-binding protein [Larsenimonas rhizosphaerae]MCM2130364.1 winged helix DNA-binding protein [Larsenimonas rhizosphaerae]MCX2523069.1 winged helix DNA-binding protein [Larsenimonas rhizosphaerae]
MSEPETASSSSIVSSDHLSHKASELSEFEYGLMVSSNAFNRWVVRCMNATGFGELSTLEVLVLNSVNHRQRAKRANDLCLVLNIEDSHTVTYALKKLVGFNLVAVEKRGKESFYLSTERGRDACRQYGRIREACLIESFEQLGLDREEIHRAAGLLRTLSGLYDQAARAAATL